MPSREEMRREYQRKKASQKSALMFLYALGIAGAGFVFEDELSEAYGQVQTMNRDSKQTVTQVSNHVENAQAVNQASVPAVEQAKPAETFVPAVEQAKPAETFVAAVEQAKPAETFVAVQDERTDSNISPQTAQVIPGASAQIAQIDSNVSAQTDAATNLNDEQAVEAPHQSIKEMPTPTPVPMPSNSTTNTLAGGELSTDSLTTGNSKNEGLSKRLSTLQTDKLQGSMTQSESSLDQAVEQMDLERKTGTIKKGCRVSKESCSFVESAQKAGLSEADTTFITQKLAGDIELGQMKAGDKFEVVTGLNKDKNVREVVYVALTIKGEKYERYAWTNKNGERDFYTPDGMLPAKEIMKFPVEYNKRISSPFGWRTHPITKDRRMHKGVDLALPVGTPIKAAADGVVTYVGSGRGYGNFVEIKHKNGYTTRYAHLSGFAKGLKKGKKVHAGQNIATGGNTGMSTGPHLHFEVRIKGEAVNPHGHHRLEGSKKLEKGQMKEFLALVDAVHMDVADLPHKNRHLRDALAQASQPPAVNSPSNLSKQNDSSLKSGKSSELVKPLKNLGRIPAVSLPISKRGGLGS